MGDVMEVKDTIIREREHKGKCNRCDNPKAMIKTVVYVDCEYCKAWHMHENLTLNKNEFREALEKINENIISLEKHMSDVLNIKIVVKEMEVEIDK